MAILTDIGQQFSADAQDFIHFVKVSDTTQNAAGSSYKIRKQEFLLDYPRLTDTNYFGSGADYRELGIRRTVGGVDPTMYMNVTSGGESFLGRYDGVSQTRGLQIANSGLSYFDGTSFLNIPVAGDYLSTTATSYINGGTSYRELGVIREIGGIDIKTFLNTASDGSSLIGNFDGTDIVGLNFDEGLLNFIDSTGTKPIALKSDVLRSDITSYAQNAVDPTAFLETGIKRVVGAENIEAALSIDVNKFLFLARRNATTGDPQTAFALGDLPYFYDGAAYREIYHTGNLPVANSISTDITPAVKRTPSYIDVFGGGNWFDYYGGGATVSIDNTIFQESKQSLKIISQAGTGFNGASAGSFTQDWSNKSFRIWVRSDDWANVTEASILMSTTGAFSAFYFYDFKSQMLYNNNNEWIEIAFTFADLNAIGAANISTVNQLLLKTTTNDATTPTVWFNGLQVIDETPSSGLVTFTFDDIWNSDYTESKEYMDKYGYVGTSFIIPEVIGTPNKLTQGEIDVMAHQGWEFGGHGALNLLSLSLVDAEAALAATKTYMNTYNYKGSNNYSYPNGGYNTDILKLTRKYFGTSRTIDGNGQNTANLIPMKVVGRTISYLTPVATIQGWIADAVANNEWLILVWHRIVASGASIDTEYNRADFQAIVDYAKTNSVKVLPYSEAYEYCKLKTLI